MFAVMEALLFVLCSSITSETAGQIVITSQIHTTTELPCSCNIDPERTLIVQWYRSTNSDVFERNGKAIASWGKGGITSNSPGYEIKDDFSIAIHHVNQTSQGLYRCIVTPVDGDAAESEYDVKLNTYANPYSPPFIEYSRHTNGINVTCSVSRVFPQTFPTFKSYESSGTNEIKGINKDGTYNTAVSNLFPLSGKDTAIQCDYSNVNFESMSFLPISDCIDQPVNEDQVLTNGSCPCLNRKYNLRGLWIVCLAFLLEIFTLIIIAFAIKNGPISVMEMVATRTIRRIKYGRTHHEETRGKMQEMEGDQPVDQSKKVTGRMKQCITYEQDEEASEEMEEISAKNGQPLDQNEKGQTKQCQTYHEHHEETVEEMEEIRAKNDNPGDQNESERMKQGRTYHEHDEETLEEMDEIRAKNDQAVSQDDKNVVRTLWPVIVMAIQVTVTILLAAYLGIVVASKK